MFSFQAQPGGGAGPAVNPPIGPLNQNLQWGTVNFVAPVANPPPLFFGPGQGPPFPHNGLRVNNEILRPRGVQAPLNQGLFWDVNWAGEAGNWGQMVAARLATISNTHDPNGQPDNEIAQSLLQRATPLPAFPEPFDGSYFTLRRWRGLQQQAYERSLPGNNSDTFIHPLYPGYTDLEPAEAPSYENMPNYYPVPNAANGLTLGSDVIPWVFRSKKSWDFMRSRKPMRNPASIVMMYLHHTGTGHFFPTYVQFQKTTGLIGSNDLGCTWQDPADLVANTGITQGPFHVQPIPFPAIPLAPAANPIQPAMAVQPRPPAVTQQPVPANNPPGVAPPPVIQPPPAAPMNPAVPAMPHALPNGGNGPNNPCSHPENAVVGQQTPRQAAQGISAGFPQLHGEISDMFFVSHIPDSQDPFLDWDGCVPHQSAQPNPNPQLGPEMINLKETIKRNDPCYKLLEAYCYALGDSLAVIDGAVMTDAGAVPLDQDPQVLAAGPAAAAVYNNPQAWAPIENFVRTGFTNLQRAIVQGFPDQLGKSAFENIMLYLYFRIAALDNGGYVTTGYNPAANPASWANLDQTVTRHVSSSSAHHNHANVGYISHCLSGTYLWKFSFMSVLLFVCKLLWNQI